MRHILTHFLFIAMAASGIMAAPALAAEGAPGTNVEMPYLMAPMTDANGKLTGYAYISSRVVATSGTYALAIRDRLAFIQDAFVRDVNGAAISNPGDPAAVDTPALQARFLTDARRIMGAGKVASVAVLKVQIAALHPRMPASDPPPESTPPAAPQGPPASAKAGN